MLFWPGVQGEFMGMLPVTLIFVLSASLIVALIYLPVMGGVSGRLSRVFDRASNWLRGRTPWWLRAVLVPPSFYLVFLGAMQVLNPAYLLPAGAVPGVMGSLFGAFVFLAGAFAASITLDAAKLTWQRTRVKPRKGRTPFGRVIHFIAGNPIMPIVSIVAVFFVVFQIAFVIFPQRSLGVEFFVESEPEQATTYVRARGNLSLAEKDALVEEVEKVILDTEGIDTAFAFAGAGGLNNNTGGVGGPRDTIGQVQIETIPWEDRAAYAATRDDLTVEDLEGDVVLARMKERLSQIPGIFTEVLNLAQGPAQGKPVHLRMKGSDPEALMEAAAIARAKFEATPGLIDIEDSRPLPGIDWQIDVDVEKAGRYGADVATVGAMVQLVTRGILLDTMRVDSSDEEIDIRVRLPEEDRVLSTLDSLRVRTADGLVPLSNFISREPVAKLAQIDRVDQSRYFDVKADVGAGLLNEDGAPMNPNERIAYLTEWLDTDNPLPRGVDWEWTGDQEEQAESQAFLQTAFAGALGLMFIILLAQFNSFYNAFLVLLAVVLSTTGVLIGMRVMQQPFSIIMTGTGIVALAGIVVNNNIVLIDTYQELSAYMPRQEAIVRTAEQRIRPVLLTTITTMAGLTPMMFGISLDFFGGGFSIDSPTALWWKQLATAVVFGLGIATVLTLLFTPSMLALRVWVTTYARWIARALARLSMGRASRAAQDWALQRAARRVKAPEILWDVDPVAAPRAVEDAPELPLRAAE